MNIIVWGAFAIFSQRQKQVIIKVCIKKFNKDYYLDQCSAWLKNGASVLKIFLSVTYYGIDSCSNINRIAFSVVAKSQC